jgi:transposase
MSNTSIENFVIAWQNSSSREEVAAKCDMSPSSVSSMASRLRKAGVKLKLFSKGRKKLSKNDFSVEKLNSLIETLT